MVNLLKTKLSAVLIAFVLISSHSHAYAADKIFGVEGVIGLGYLSQGSGSTPLCCDERDPWGAPGFEAGARLVIRYAKSGRLTLGGLFGTYSTDENSGPNELTVSQYLATFGADYIVPDKHREFRVGGTIVYGKHSTDLEGIPRKSGTDALSTIGGLGLRIGLDFPVGSIRLGVEAEALMKAPGFHSDYGLRLVVGW